MALTSLNYQPPPPEPLGPLQPGYRRVMFTSAYNMDTLTADLHEVRDVLADAAEHYVANGMAMLFDDLPPEPEPEPVVVERPAIAAPKAAWVEYAVSQGAESKLDVQCMTKAEIQNKYGDRL